MNLLSQLKLKNDNIDFLKTLDAERATWINRKGYITQKLTLEKLSKLNPNDFFFKIENDQIYLTTSDKIKSDILDIAKDLIPWKKGPFILNDHIIDSEWKSELKFARFKEALGNLENKNILDIGSNNGYFMFLLSQFNPKIILGIDPVIPCQSQFHFINHFYQKQNVFFKLWGIEHIKYLKNSFDLILFMGIIYHHRHPLEQLIDIRECLKPGGKIIFETIGIPGIDSFALFPENRYANMKNIWFIPTLSCSINWLKKAKFKNINVLDDSLLTSNEQRKTNWCKNASPSLENFLDQSDISITIEGHPAPRRFCIEASI